MIDLWGVCRLRVQSYTIADARITGEIRLAVLSDVHSSSWGAHQKRLLSALEEQKPDFVLLLGDIFHNHGKNKEALELLRSLGKTCRCYFVLGNHEYRTGDVAAVKEAIQDAGIPILDGKSADLAAGSARIRLAGIDDGWGGVTRQRLQLVQAGASRDDGVYSILAIHVPNNVKSILPLGFDLMLAGHTHGGQIRIPGLLNGLYAPGQGFFPRYGGGRYDFGEQTLIISRGLSKKPWWLPRIWNPPELVIVMLKGE